MGQKLHRGRRSVFRKRRTGLKTFLWILTAILIVAGGYVAAMLLGSQRASSVSTDATPTTSQTVTPPTESTAPTVPAPSEPDAPASVTKGIKGFYLPFSMLSADTLSEVSLLAEAKEAGFNAVVFDLKDTEGRLYYRFSDPTAKQVGSYVDNALSKKQLKALFTLFQENGLTPIPRLHTFKDNLGAKALPDARIGLKGNTSQSWYDDNPSSGGKRWLNPYDNDAHEYILALSEELKALGAGAVMLDSVQFPHQVSSANFGSDNANLKWDEVLTLFIRKAKERLGADCPVILSCTGESITENATQIYGGNPLTFAPTMAAPQLVPDGLQQAVEQMVLRTKVMDEANKPLLSPMLNVSGCSTAQIKQAIADCVAGGVEDYILYSAKGTYDFDAYQ